MASYGIYSFKFGLFPSASCFQVFSALWQVIAPHFSFTAQSDLTAWTGCIYFATPLLVGTWAISTLGHSTSCCSEAYTFEFLCGQMVSFVMVTARKKLLGLTVTLDRVAGLSLCPRNAFHHSTFLLSLAYKDLAFSSFFSFFDLILFFRGPTSLVLRATPGSVSVSGGVWKTKRCCE